MRESYRDKNNRKARINREKEEKRFDNRRKIDRRSGENRREGQRRVESKSFNGKDDRRGPDRRSADRRQEERRTVYDRRENSSDEDYDDIVAGRNAVLELLKSDKDINKIFVERGEKHGSINEIIARAKEARVVLVEVDKDKLDGMAENHQGVVAIVPPFNYSEVEDILDLAKEREEDPFVLILDGIEDPHNLGSIIRTAETAGVHGIIIPRRRAALVNSTVTKVACGAAEYVKIARVNNIKDTIRALQSNGIWVCGTKMTAKKCYYEQDFTEPVAIVIGNEEKGMSDLVDKTCDYSVKIPMKGKIESLNASVSAGIIIYEVLKQRN